jgi:glutaredoxin
MTLRRVFYALILSLATVSALVIACSAADEEPAVLFFYQEDCPDCAEVSGLLDELLSTMPDLTLRSIEISEPGALELLAALCEANGIETANVPVVFVHGEVIIGAGRAQEFQLRAAIGDCLIEPCVSPLLVLEAEPFPWTDVLWLAAAAALFVFLMAWQIR